MMKGEWVILLWALLGTVFLVKTTPVGGLVRRVRRQPPAVQATVALCLLVAVITGGTKPGGTNELFRSSQPEIADPDNSSLIIQQSSMPSWWTHDATDTDGDGIPDLWEKWTHGNRQVADGGIDRDDDGLTDLEEFQNQTDPRTADTDGDGFDDAFEVANGMDTLVQEDFTPVEPDEDQNGIIDLWENEPYLYGFTDRDQNGFDDYYEAYYLEPASDDNYDVRVDVYTTRSAALTWTVGALTEGVVLPATAMTSVRIRLPFKSDARIELLAAPQGDALPAGELWKARLRLSFAPRDGQTAIGTCIVSDGGDIQQKAPESVSAVVRFPGGVPMTRRSTSSGGEGLVIDILERRFEIIPHSDIYHGPDDVVGPFTITNAVNIDQSAVHWSADFGTMSPSPGGSSTLTITSVPPDEGNIVVTASLLLDDVFRVVKTAIVNFCPGKDLFIGDYGENFSPHLGETNVFNVMLPGCDHQNTPSWMEVEIMRQTTTGWDHVAYVDLDSSSPGLDRWRETTSLSTDFNSFSWDGKTLVDLPLADHPDVFAGPKGSFNRAMPAMKKGDPVPPPFYTLFVRVWDQQRQEVLDECSKQTYVPQVVKVYWHPRIEAILQRSITARSNGVDVILYQGCDSSSAEYAVSTLSAQIGAFFPSTVNIRIMHTTVIDAGYKKVMLVDGMDRPDGRKGETQGPWNARNASSEGVSFLFVENLLADVQRAYAWSLRGAGTFPTELSADNIVGYYSATGAHEAGHSHGLVDGNFLNAGSDAAERHNGTYNPRKLMNRGGLLFMEDRLNPQPMIHWMDDNRRYLEFVLPLPEQQ